MVLQVLQDLQFHTRLVLEPLLIPDQLQTHYLLRLVVQTLQGLTETTLAQKLQHFKSISYVIFHNHFVVTAFVVIAAVELVGRGALDLFGADTQEVNLLVV